MRRSLPECRLDVGEFQSTHPSRGATDGHGSQEHRLSVSIHAPLAGCDHRFAPYQDRHGCFNPRTPRGVRPSVTIIPRMICMFQSTHPSRGATGIRTVFQYAEQVSIHAPLAGCDSALCCARSDPSCFNPRTPRGVRRPPFRPLPVHRTFQSTHPSRGATALLLSCGLAVVVSIHAPLAGCDVVIPINERFGEVSIHAPLAGCDARALVGTGYDPRFQSTHPSRGATLEAAWTTYAAEVSIHAPLAGCDGRGGYHVGLQQGFNPRTPRGVRRFRSSLLTYRQGFNPRTPRGVRRPPFRPLPVHRTFQSTHPSRGATRSS